MSSEIYLFVYGSLKKGFENNSLLKKSIFKGKAFTIKKFGMFKHDFGNYPYLVEKPLNIIEGELYILETEKLLEKIDFFEDVPKLYIRKKIEVKCNNEIYLAYVYFNNYIKTFNENKSLLVWEN